MSFAAQVTYRHYNGFTTVEVPGLTEGVKILKKQATIK